MTFTLGDILGDNRLPEGRTECPLGKRAFTSKREAKAALATVTRHGANRDRTPQQAYRCHVCGGWHLGHRRGAVL